MDSIGDSCQLLKKFKVEGLYVICSIDIKKIPQDWSNVLIDTQVLQVWDVLPLDDIPRLVKRLDGIFERYTDDFMSRCNDKCLEGYHS